MADNKAKDGIKDLLSARRLGHDANQLLVDIMTRWGGTRAFADALFEEFQAANPGSLIRQNLLEMIQKLVVNNTNHNITRIVNPTDLDDEEIEGELNAMIAKAKEFDDERKGRASAPETYSPQVANETPDDWDWTAE